MMLTPPKTIKEVQSLNGKIATLNRFVLRVTDKCLPFFYALKKALIAGLDLAKAVGATNVVIYCNFQVVTSQINGDYECKGKRMKKYLEQVKIRVKDL